MREEISNYLNRCWRLPVEEHIGSIEVLPCEDLEESF